MQVTGYADKGVQP